MIFLRWAMKGADHQRVMRNRITSWVLRFTTGDIGTSLYLAWIWHDILYSDTKFRAFGA